jgi:hypothetical protein
MMYYGRLQQTADDILPKSHGSDLDLSGSLRDRLIVNTAYGIRS